MTGFLLDTNVISATAPDRRDVPLPAKAAARAWISTNQDRLFLPVTAVAEIAAGIGDREGSGATRYAMELAYWLAGLLASYPDRVLPLDTRAALRARELQRVARQAGITPGFADMSLGCIALEHGLVMATRNLHHFAPMGVAAVDPFALV